MGTLVRTVVGRMRRRVECSEQGDTLIELLIAIVIIALTMTALLGALVTALTTSTTQKGLSTVDAILNSFAQSAQSEAQQSFVNCTTTPYRLISAPMPSAGPVGASVTVFVTGFTAGHGLTVMVGSAPATISSGGTVGLNGDAAVTFTVPSGVSGTPSVSVNDGTNTTSPTPFVVGGTVKGTTPKGYSISVNPVQQWNAQPPTVGFEPIVSGTCESSGAQELTAFVQGPNGASGTLSFVVLHPATTTVLVAAAPSVGDPASCTPVVLGCSVTFTATVIPPNSTTPNPTGTMGMQWAFSQSPGNPSCTDSTLTNIAGTNTSQTSCTVANAEVGTYEVSANYPAPGCSNCNYGAGSGSGSITVGEANSSTVLTSSSSPSPAQPGATLSFKATVGATPANANDPQPSGTVLWTITPPSGTAPTCTGAAGDSQHMTDSGTGTNSTTCSFTLGAGAPTGTYSASAVYQGDGNYNSSSSASPATITVSKGTPTLSFSTNPSSPQVGSNYTVTVTVNGTGGITPTGTVTWTITPPSGTAPTCAQSTLNGAGQATCTVTNAVAGTYTVAASYGGSTAYNGASGQTQVVVTLAPAGFNIQGVPSGTPNGKPSSGDQIVYTYNQAMSITSIQRGWSGASEAVTAQFSRVGSQTQLSIACTGGGFGGCSTINLGTVNLGDTGSSHYTSGFGTVDVTATMAASTNAAGQTVITITLTQSSGSFSAVSGTTALTWTPSNAATNPTGVACAMTPINEVGAPKANF